MDPAQKAFWEAVGADGPVSIDDLGERIDDVLVAHPEFIRLEGVHSYALYSGAVLHGGATQAAVDLAERTDGAIGVINNTPTGQALEPFAKLASGIVANKARGITFAAASDNLESLRAQYGNYIKIPDAAQEDILELFEAKSWDLFKPASAHFAHHASGNVITITPDATADRVYAQSEVPHIADGLRPDPETGIRRITHVNGVAAEVFDQTLEKLPPLEGTPYRATEALLDGVGKTQASAYEPLRAEFDETFKANFRDAGGRVSADVAIDGSQGYSSKTALDADNWDKVSPGLDGKVAPHSYEGLIEQHTAIKYQDASLEKLRSADAAGKLRTFTDEAGTTHAVDLQGHATYTLDFDADTGRPIIGNGVQFPDAESAGRAFGQSLSSHGDLSSVQRSLAGAAEHLSDLGRPKWASQIDDIASESGRFLGRASKVLGPLGVGAAGLEVASLEMKLQDFEDFGLVDPEAMLAYRAILVTHTAQATVDPTLIGGEAITQGAFFQWKEHYGIDEKVGKALAPGSLVKDVYTAKAWLDAQADAAGEAALEYAASVIENPGRLKEDMENIRNATADAIESAYDASVENLQAASEVLENYASSRIEDPSLILQDLKDVGETTLDLGIKGMGTVNPLFKPLVAVIENYRAGPEIEESVDTGAPIAGDPNIEGSRIISMREALQDLHDTQTQLTASDPKGESNLSQVLNNPEGQAIFIVLVDARVDGLRVEYPPETEPNIRIKGLFETARAEISARGLESEMVAAREMLEPAQTDSQMPENQVEDVYDAAL